MSDVITATDMKTEIMRQISALSDAADAIALRPIDDPNAFTAVTDYEEALHNLYLSYGAPATVPQMDPDSITVLDGLLTSLRVQIADSAATSQIILGAAEAVGTFRGVAVS
ncbi:hypothetical protein [Paraburkholderia sp. J10-1]|uniref:hypothetical protein n=1 Tax=Paraburkholderia sp. J10-1 TaxID=2805430 RepID=UPI002AB6C5C2|nr:hypothetical protein [Paraburkholderia sp. J10-1]